MIMKFKLNASALPPSAMIGLSLIMVYAVVALGATWIAPYGESEITGGKFLPWSSQHWLGTDALGRDVLSRLIYGAQNTVGIAVLTTIIAFTLGGVLGLMSAILGGWYDQLGARVVDILMAVPPLIFALLALTILGTSAWTMILVIAVLDSTRVYRLVRSVAQNILVMDYIEVARLRGESIWWLMRSEVLPNSLPPLFAEFGLRFCFVFLFISALSFLGLGVQPPAADWGSMVRESARFIAFTDFSSLEGMTFGLAPLIPAMAIAILTVSVNLVVDWILDRTHLN